VWKRRKGKGGETFDAGLVDGDELRVGLGCGGGVVHRHAVGQGEQGDVLPDFLGVEGHDVLVAGHDLAGGEGGGLRGDRGGGDGGHLLISMNIALTSACFWAVASTRALTAARCSRYLKKKNNEGW